MKAIETVYNGHRFRSRLEARWAVFFDAARIPWQYEPEGFEATPWDDAPPIRYLPDFYLPETGTWVEVKGTNAAMRADLSRLEGFLDWDSPLPGMQWSSGTTRGLLLLGPIPNFTNPREWPVHTIIQHHKGLLINDWKFPRTWFTRHDPLQIDRIDIEDLPILESHTAATCPITAGMAAAYAQARQARFEHGQVGGPQGWSRRAS